MATKIASVEEQDDIPVLLEDQEKINLFSCLNVQLKEHEARIANLTEDIQRLRDAVEECALCMEPNGLMLKIGDAFICDVDDASVTKHCEEHLEMKQSDLQQAESNKAAVESQMSELKTALYAKFGNKRINLDVK